MPRRTVSNLHAVALCPVLCIIFVCGSIAAVAITHAQSRPGLTAVSGQVLDSDGKPVAGATVNLQTSYGRGPHASRTDKDGQFEFRNLRSGLYDVRAQASGKWSEWQRNVVARSGQPAQVTLRLTLAAAPPESIPQVALTGKIREWTIPVENSQPHDPAVDPAGNIWLTLLHTNQIARFNPKTGEWKLFDSPTARSSPHGLTSDAAGNIWYTENSAGKIGRIDARTGGITEFATSKATDPHTIIVGPDAAIWFTAQHGNVIGRLDPRTRELREFPVPTPGAQPCSIVIGADGALWFAEFGANKLGRLDPRTGAITEFEVPEKTARLRRLASVGAMIYFTDVAGGNLGRFDTETRIFRAWASPGGPDSQPWALEAGGHGEIWFCEFVGNQLVRFSPDTETLDRFPLPSPKSELKQMVRDSTGRLWLALSGVNKLALLE